MCQRTFACMVWKGKCGSWCGIGVNKLFSVSRCDCLVRILDVFVLLCKRMDKVKKYTAVLDVSIIMLY